MKILMLAVGKVRGTLERSVREFEERAARYWKLEIVEVAAGLKSGGDRDATAVLAAEANRIAGRLPEEGELWALTRVGKGMSSETFADELGTRALHGGPSITFLIGGAFGLDPELQSTRVHRAISLSRMTLPHEMARLLLAEQLYRAGTILRNEPYHKGGGR